MKELVWNDRFNIGIEEIDRDHRRIFSTINKMIQFDDYDTKGEWLCVQSIKYFKRHAEEHFDAEEEYMQSIGYSDYEKHKRLHDDFRYKLLPALERELAEEYYSQMAVRHFVGMCVGWLSRHIMMDDRAIVGMAASKWGDLRPESELMDLSQTVILLMQETFGIVSELISSFYGGENFGESIALRLNYRSANGESRQVFFIFENSLLVEKMSDVLGIHLDKMSNIVVNAARNLITQFMSRLYRYVPNLDLRKLEKESVMTEEQMMEIFQDGCPQYSMLFDTGIGYFAFCIITPPPPEGEELPALDEEEIAERISEHQDEMASRKRVLVVDDSSVFVESMKKLLGSEYYITVAYSAYTAIKSIVLNRPDLILLDYEMPVCDGRQLLEMLRAEPETKDIPAIFLSGRGDRMSILNVMKLNPAGYLLKSMQPEEMKGTIREFFEKQAIQERMREERGL